MTVLIVGAGASNLFTELVLKKIEINHSIIEKSPNLRIDSAGIALPRNAMELLTLFMLK